MSQQNNNLADLELLFIGKLNEKFHLTQRGIKKFFSQFDSDHNGLLDIDEISVAVKLLLNGIGNDQVRDLMKRFDFNNDGKISEAEFLQYLLKRKDAPVSNSTVAAREASNARAAIREKKNTLQKFQPTDMVGRSILEGYSNIDRNRNSNSNSKTTIAVAYDNSSNSSNANSSINNDNYNDDNDNEYHSNENYDDYDKNSKNNDNYNDNDDDTDVDEQYDNYPRSSSNHVFNNNYAKNNNNDRNNKSNSDNESVYSNCNSETDSNFDPSNSKEIENRCKTYLQNLKSYLDKKVIAERDNRTSGNSSNNRNRLIMSTSELLNFIGSELLSKAFQPYAGVWIDLKIDLHFLLVLFTFVVYIYVLINLLLCFLNSNIQNHIITATV